MAAKRYKVLALSVGGANNKIYHSGDEVGEDNFPPGNAELLVKSKHLLALDSKVEVKSEGSELDKITVKEIKAKLTAAGIDFDKNASKEELFKLL